MWNNSISLAVKKNLFASFLLICYLLSLLPHVTDFIISLFFSASDSRRVSVSLSIPLPFSLFLSPSPSIHLFVQLLYLSSSCRKKMKFLKEYSSGNTGMFGSRDHLLESYLKSYFHFGINSVGLLGRNGKKKMLSLFQKRSWVPNERHHPLWLLLALQILNL